MAFQAQKVFGTFEKRAPALTYDIAHSLRVLLEDYSCLSDTIKDGCNYRPYHQYFIYFIVIMIISIDGEIR